MNFDAARLARLSGLSVDTETKTLTESVNSETQALNENASHDDDLQNVHEKADEDVLFELDEDEVYEGALEDDEVLEEDDAPAATAAADNSASPLSAAELKRMKKLEEEDLEVDALVAQLLSNLTTTEPDDLADYFSKINFEEDYTALNARKAEINDEMVFMGTRDAATGPRKGVDIGDVKRGVAGSARVTDAPVVVPKIDELRILNMDTLRETVIELRDEILEEQAAKKQALAEAPARAAIRKEIQSLLSEMPGDAATNWMYGKKGRPSASDTAAANKSRATALFGLGFETN